MLNGININLVIERVNMPGTKAGGLKAKETNLKKHGADFYSRIGAKGGKHGGLKGFAVSIERAREAGRKGGLRSRRGPSRRNPDGTIYHSYDYIRKHMDI